MRLEIRAIRRAVHRAAVAMWHSHHKPTVGETFALGAFVDDKIVAAGVMGIPVAPALQDDRTWEVSRLAVGPDAPPYTASRLLGACGRVMTEAGITRQISYTRVDEPGTCYRAAGWTPVAYVKPGQHLTGNRAGRAIHAVGLFGSMYSPSTEPIARVRWERGSRVSEDRDVEWDATARLWIPIRRAA